MTGADCGTSLGATVNCSIGGARAPSGLARFFGTDPFRDRRGMLARDDP